MLPPRLGFVPYDALGDVANVVVDGSPTSSTRLTLSHWPGSPTPVALLDDLSAQIAFRALDQPDLFDGVDAVSNNHFDQDGLASAFVVLDPQAAIDRRERVVDVARAGDFGTFRDRDSIRVAFALEALADPARSTLDAGLFSGGHDEQTARLYLALLPRFAELVDDPEGTRRLWEEQDAHLGESLRAVAGGAARLRESPGLDLVTVTVAESWAQRMAGTFDIAPADALHPSAVHQSSACLRVATIQGHRYRVELRYESWVMLRSRRPLPRPDLRVLATQLSAAEVGPTTWTADGPGSLTPTLCHSGEASSIPPERFVSMLERFLRDAPPAFDPYPSGIADTLGAW